MCGGVGVYVWDILEGCQAHVIKKHGLHVALDLHDRPDVVQRATDDVVVECEGWGM